MQTFLPYPDFHDCANCLDKKRQWKQVVEAKQILCTLRAKDLPEDWKNSKTYLNQKWINHPAVKMWNGFEEALKIYYNVFLAYSRKSGIKTELEFLKSSTFLPEFPFYIGNQNFHNAMKSKLFQKDNKHYSLFSEFKHFNNGQYLWPDNQTKTFKTI